MTRRAYPAALILLLVARATAPAQRPMPGTAPCGAVATIAEWIRILSARDRSSARRSKFSSNGRRRSAP